MALILSLASVVQSNDNTVLRVTDGTGSYSVDNTGGWGTPNTDFADIDGSTTTLTLQITYTNSDEEETVYTAIDIYEFLGTTPTSTADLVFDITPDMLIDADGTAMGEVDSEFPDGWYEFTYTIDHNEVGGTGASYESTSFKLVTGIIRTQLYNKFLVVPYDLLTVDPKYLQRVDLSDIIEPLYYASLFEGLLARLNSARKTQKLVQLKTLESELS